MCTLFSVPARIVQFSSNISINKTKRFSLNCTVHGVPTPSVGIVAVGRHKEGSSTTQNGTTINGNPYVVYAVGSAVESDSGKYKCIVQNDVNLGSAPDVRKAERTVEVTVNGTPYMLYIF